MKIQRDNLSFGEALQFLWDNPEWYLTCDRYINDDKNGTVLTFKDADTPGDAYLVSYSYRDGKLRNDFKTTVMGRMMKEKWKIVELDK